MTTLPALIALQHQFEEWGIPTGDDDQRLRDVEALERRTGLTLPPTFRDYLTKLSPGTENFDDELTNWWPVSRIKTIAEELGDPIYTIYHPEVAAARDQYLVFADYSIWAWAWAISCTRDGNNGRVFVIMGSKDGDKFVAESFEAFVKLYLHDPLSLC